MSDLEKRYEAALAHGALQLDREPKRDLGSGVRQWLLEAICELGVSVEGLEHIQKDPAIYAIVDHPTFMDGPRAYHTLSQAQDLPLLGVTWVENFTHRLSGPILKGRSHAHPIQRENMAAHVEKKGRQEWMPVVQNEALMERGRLLNQRTIEFFKSRMEAGEASLLLSLVHTKSSVNDAILPFARDVLEATTEPIVPISFHLDANSRATRILKPSITRIHQPIEGREHYELKLQSVAGDRERIRPLNLNEAEPTHLARYQFAAEFISDQDTVLDLPCGVGYGTQVLAERAGKVTGVDISEKALDHAQRLFDQKNIDWHCGDMETPHFVEKISEEGAADLIVSFEGIEHIQNPDDFLHNCREALSKNGKLLISTPRKPHGSPFHITEYSEAEFERLLVQNGFEILEKYGQVKTDIAPMQEFGKPEDYYKYNFIFLCERAVGK